MDDKTTKEDQSYVAMDEVAKNGAKLEGVINEMDLNLRTSKFLPAEKEGGPSQNPPPNLQKAHGHARLNTWADFNNTGNNKQTAERSRCKSLDMANLKLGDISNPLENEAENAIIRALEKKRRDNQSEEDLLFLKATNAVSSDLEKSYNELEGTTYVFPAEPGKNLVGKTDSPYAYLETKTPSGSPEESSIAGKTKLQDLSTQFSAIERKGALKGPNQRGYLTRAKSHKQLGKDVTGVAQINELEHTSTNKGNNMNGQSKDDMFDEEAQYSSHSSLKSKKTSSNGSDTTKKSSSTSTSDLFGRKNMKTGFLKSSKEMVEELHWSLKFKSFLKVAIFYVVMPGLLISAALFYAAGNPMVGEARTDVTPDDVSYSWWILFVVRQVIMLCLAKLTEIVIIEILTIRLRTFQRHMGSFGSFVALSLIQSRGWPYIITLWATLDFCFLQGNRKFAMHWLYYTNISWFKMCTFIRENNGIVNGQFVPPDIRLEGSVTSCNPAGQALTSDLYSRILISAIVLGCAVTLKRVLFGIYVGKKATGTYIPQLEKVMAKMVIISEVAQLAKEILQEAGVHRGSQYENGEGKITLRSASGDPVVSEHDGSISEDSVGDDASTESIQSKDSHNLSNQESMTQMRSNTKDTEVMRDSEGGFRDTALPSINHGEKSPAISHKITKQKLSELMGEWEEPVVNKKKSALQQFSVQDVLEFRRAVYGLDKRHPFSYAFGPADTREHCLESAKKVYGRLLLYTPGERKLPFDTVSLIAVQKNGEMDEKKVKKLIRMFRPNDHGDIAALAFVKSCDKVYKQLRTLRAAIINSSQIDKAFEQILNVFFYFAILLVLLAIVRVDPWPLIASSSAFALGFSFMFSKAASKYFDGILLILVQKPFDIGDRIHLSDPKQDTSANGSSTWIVEEVALHSTTLRFATTNEVATFSNGVLADLRIINANRSPNAVVYIYNKFASDVPFENVMVFKSAIESFVKERPSQWVAMNGFRSTRLEADLGFIEYVIVLTHVEKWQNVGVILNSKAELSSYCLEVQKQLGMKYEAPPLPVNLGMVTSHGEASFFEQDQYSKEEDNTSKLDFDNLASLFSENGVRKRK